MKKLAIVLTLILPLLLVGCKKEEYGAGVDTQAPKISVKDAFLKPELLGKSVVLEGKIVSQCQSNGCWFFLEDGTGQIYVDLSTNKFSLPAMSNKEVIASGTIARSQKSILLIASGVEVK
mgnify:CR=1 FL=1